MKRHILISIFFLVLACKQVEKRNEETLRVVDISKPDLDSIPKIGTNNYAIIWKWATRDRRLVEENLIAISNEMNKLRKNGLIENAYYNPDSEIDKFEYFSNISYFIKASSKESAEEILNNLIIVKKGIGEYSIHPVGTMWFGRETEKINQKGITNSYVSVWSPTDHFNSSENDELLTQQADSITALYNEGRIENVYWEFRGKTNENDRRANEVKDFVFFINTNSEEEARKLCDNLPLTKKGLVTYQLYSVGTFWFGKYEDQ